MNAGRIVRIPFLQRIDRLDTTTIAFDVDLPRTTSIDGASLHVQLTVQVLVASHEPLVFQAVERFLGTSRTHIENVAKSLVVGILKEVLGSMTADQIRRDRWEFANSLMKHEVDFERVGLVLDNVQIQSVEVETEGGLPARSQRSADLNETDIFCSKCHHETSGESCQHCGADPVLDGRYAFLRMLGSGAHGFTWLARHMDGGPLVAIKELSFRRLDTFKSLDLFKREVDVLKALEDPSIPRYLEDFHVEDGRHIAVYLVQEFIEGDALEVRRTSQAEALKLLKEVLKILVYLHGLSPPVIHRDIKPSNIMRRSDGSFVLIDFGSTRAALETTMGGSTIAGTLGYMAPEQLLGHANSASDLYGLAATTVTLLANQPVLELIDSSRPELWESMVNIDPGLRKILRTMLHPDPQRRAADAYELLQDLERWEREVGVSAAQNLASMSVFKS